MWRPSPHFQYLSRLLRADLQVHGPLHLDEAAAYEAGEVYHNSDPAPDPETAARASGRVIPIKAD